MAEWSESAPRPPRPRFSLITRVLAPLALIAALIALFLIVDAAREDGSSGDVATKAESANGSTSAKGEEGDGPENPKTYVVKSGDSLSTIADKFGVSVDRLLRLNADSGIDPQALTVGDELKIR